MNHLALKSVTVTLGENRILDSLSLSIEPGEIICLLGASGEGKTTLLRTITGFIQPDEGEVWCMNNKVADNTFNAPVERRQIGMVFQDYALFPHLTVKQNIVFGIKQLDKSGQQQRMDELSEVFGMQEFIDKYPHQLSGGQQQRVAIARALAPKPNIVLLDEPFASLDMELREHLAGELRQALKTSNVTAIMVCHNQLEAFAMADRVGLLSQGKILQIDTAYNLYHHPVTPYVADFVGEGVMITGKIHDDQNVMTALGMISSAKPHGYTGAEKVRVLIRPDDILHDDVSPMKAVVLKKLFRGAEFLYTLQLNNGEQVLSLVPSHHDHNLNESIGIRLEIDHLVVFNDH